MAIKLEGRPSALEYETQEQVALFIEYLQRCRGREKVSENPHASEAGTKFRKERNS